MQICAPSLHCQIFEKIVESTSWSDFLLCVESDYLQHFKQNGLSLSYNIYTDLKKLGSSPKKCGGQLSFVSDYMHTFWKQLLSSREDFDDELLEGLMLYAHKKMLAEKVLTNR